MKLSFCTFLILSMNLLIGQPLSGDYIVGEGGDFLTLKEAAKAMTDSSTVDTVRLKLKPGIYDAAVVWFPLGIKVITSLDKTNKAVLHNHEISITNHTTFENIKFTCDDSSIEDVFSLNQVTNINILNCDFESGINTNFISSNGSIILTNVSIKGCHFSGGNYAIKLTLAPSMTSKNFVIENNTFENFNTSGLKLWYGKYTTIKGNTFLGTKGMAIDLSIIREHFEVSGNYIHGAFEIGMSINSHQTLLNDSIKVFNNVVSVGKGRAGKFFSLAKTGFYHNTFYNNSDTTFAADFDNIASFKVQNNLFNNGGSFSTVKYSNITNNSFDFNNYFSPNSSVINDGSSFYTLSLYQNNTNQEINSMNVDPNLSDSINLKLTCSSPSSLKGASFNGLALDYDGFKRDTLSAWWGARELSIEDGSPFNLSGTAFKGNDTLKNGRVYCFAHVNVINPVMDTIGQQELNIQNGSFSFTNLPSYPFILKVVPDAVLADNFVASYYDGSVFFEGVEKINVSDCNQMNVNVETIALGALEVGNSVISGVISMDDIGKTTNPIPGLDVVLDKIPPAQSVARTQTDSSGSYTFNQLPIGTYEVWIDYPGVPNEVIHSVSIVSDGSVISTVDYCVDTTSTVDICGVSTNVQINQQGSSFNIFPNPVENEINVNVENLDFVRIIDLSGKIIKESKDKKISLAYLNKGMYLIQVFVKNGDTYVQTFVKK